MAAICGNLASLSTPSYPFSSQVLCRTRTTKEKKRDISSKNKPKKCTLYLQQFTKKDTKDSIPSI